MVKSIVSVEVEPGYEDIVLDSIKNDPQLMEAHLTSYQNEAIIFIDSKNETAADGFVDRLRAMRCVRNTRHAHIIHAEKHGIRRGKTAGKLAFVYATLEPGTESLSLTALAESKVTRDVLAITGPLDLLITCEIKGLQDVWSISVEIARAVRFVHGTQTYLSTRSLVKD